jgi:hypothetical protein
MVTLMRLPKRGQKPDHQDEHVDTAEAGDPTNSPGASINGAGERGSGPLGGRLPLVVAVSVVLVLAVAAIGYLKMSSRDGDLGQTQLTRTQATARHGASTSASPSGSASASSTGVASAKDPFATGAAGVAGSPSATGSPVVATTGSPSVATTGPSSPSVSISTATVTRFSTVTAAAAVYLGLAGWTSADLPMFWVDNTFATPALGDSFATSYTYTAQTVVSGVKCADVTHSGVSTRVCEGQAVKVG